MMQLRRILAAVESFNAWAARGVSWVIVVMMCVTVYEVVMRYAFNSPTQWVFEFNYLIHGVYFMLVGAFRFPCENEILCYFSLMRR